MNFKNKVVLITGAGSGIGAATAIFFAKEGADIAIVDKNGQKLNEVASKVSALGKKPCIIYADVSKDEDAKKNIADTIKAFEKLDILINNAGIGKNGSILDGKAVEAYDAVMNVNVRAVIHLTTLAAPHLAATKGNIVNTSSIAAVSVPSRVERIAYWVSKAALDHFTRGAALELSSLGIRVNSVNPGPVNSNFNENSGYEATPAKNNSSTVFMRKSEPEEIADLILYLASDKARGITGSSFVNDNGYLLIN